MIKNVKLSVKVFATVFLNFIPLRILRINMYAVVTRNMIIPSCLVSASNAKNKDDFHIRTFLFNSETNQYIESSRKKINNCVSIPAIDHIAK
jgi:hypothetical protein